MTDDIKLKFKLETAQIAQMLLYTSFLRSLLKKCIY